MRAIRSSVLTTAMQINLASGYEIYGAYQPDTIKVFTAGGKTYMATANEGDAKVQSIMEYMSSVTQLDTPSLCLWFAISQEYDGWKEEARGESIYDQGPDCCDLSEETLAQLSDDAQLGRLNFLFRHGLTEDGKIQTLIAEGGRSVSIFELTGDYGVNLVWDSGDAVGVQHAKQDPQGTLGIFNPNQGDVEETVPEGLDGRSDNKGIEPESLEIAECGGETLDMSVKSRICAWKLMKLSSN